MEKITQEILGGRAYPRCYKHPEFLGLRKPRTKCTTCLGIYLKRKQLNIKETRKVNGKTMRN